MQTVKGDLIKMALNRKFDVIIHGCNCFCAMGGGIAAQIAHTFPEAAEVDGHTVFGAEDKLGCLSVAACPPVTVVNAYTQFHPGRDLRMPALRQCFVAVKKRFGGKSLRFGIPMIGAGIAGGNWADIAAVVEKEMAGEDVTVVEYKP